MAELPFNTDIMNLIAENRSDLLTPIFKFFTFLGDQNGYILIIALVYTIIDKKLGFQLAIVAGFTSLVNHFLKVLIRNPRPFVTDGSYKQKWLVGDIEDTAKSFSTPSGHAMGSASFYSYLYVKVKNSKLRIVFVICILLIGLSRPYLGVHYVEDIIIGWTLGLLIMYLLLRSEDRVGGWWDSKGIGFQVLLLITSSTIIWLIAGILSNWGIDGNNFATYTGFLSGFLIGRYFEMKYVNFDASSKSIIAKLIRYLFTVILTMAALIVLDSVFEMISGDDSFLGYLLRYIRYLSVALMAIFLAPLVFTKLKLADTK